ncbi:Hint domain-containing protein [Aestuariicoccus sp. MJ-SS9]|uniref:Hint domain-containing protein n=1 Tax=Aestuariicoccus sp. MJ-SS9 TaxID=3079855 RepID=UPI00290AB3C9|nr:Hint domain-containing protein [Aestuariicoccus sp. MJ-SS9]MDU8910090.1 Hint domain-containing protein [Aestuariicoccus sp. MJ-SS9]
MSWIAISGPEQSWVCPKTFDSPDTRRDRFLTRGSILLETRLSPEGRPQTLLSYDRRHPWPASLSLQAIPGGSIVLVMSQGEDVFHTLLDYPTDARTDVMRLTFSWDTRARWGRLTLERPESDAQTVRDTPPPPPLMLEDIYTLTQRPQLRQVDDDVLYFAVSTRIEPVGPMPSLTASVPIATPQGFRALDRLKTGDTVITRDNGVVPVLHTVHRVVPALGAFRPVRLRAPYFGLRRDIVVAPHQRLVIGGSEVEYIFGREAVLVPAVSLVNGLAAMHEDGHLTVRYSQVLLPGHEALMTADAGIESLYVGRLRRNKDRLEASLLRDCPRNLLPEHHRAGYQVLRPFEAIILAEARAA